MPAERKYKVIKDQLQGWDIEAQTEESAMTYVGDGRKLWAREEFFDSGIEDVRKCTADFFKEMKFHPAGKRMLDIGCGIGRMTQAFADTFGEAHGVDFSGNMIRIAKALHGEKPNLYFEVNNGVDLSIHKDNFFDFCFSYISFHHIAEFEVIANYIREIDRVLKPGGMFMFQVNTSKWVIKAGGWLPIDYRVRDFLFKIGVLKWYARIRTKGSG